MNTQKRFVLFIVTAMVINAVPCYSYISGKVTDAGGEAVSGATVTFTSESDPSRSMSAVTDTDGGYRIDIITSVAEITDSAQPQTFTLGQNYPNPFNPATLIPFTLTTSDEVRLTIYNIQGQKIRTLTEGHFPSGHHAVAWDGADDRSKPVAAGVYLYRLRAGNHTETKKMLMLDGGNTAHRSVSSGTFNAQAMRTNKPSSDPPLQTYSVTITGLDIAEYHQSNLLVADNGIYDFMITRISDILHNIAGMKLASIPGGSFSMGHEKIAKPVHTVTVSSFEMTIYEITQEQYRAVIGTNPSWSQEELKPVERVTWEDAIMFCNALSMQAGLDVCYDENTMTCDYTKNGFRLPTEAEWEYACRAGTETLYYWGDTDEDSVMKQYCWYEKNAARMLWTEPHAEKEGTQPVGTKLPNSFGLYDMCGNVWEWCNGWYYSYSDAPQTDPIGAQEGDDHVLRGGCWESGATQCMSAYRGITMCPSGTDRHIGFRIVRRP